MNEWGKEAGNIDCRSKLANVGAIILAGGLGQRLKAVGFKPFLLHNEKTFLQIAFENAFQNGLQPIAIVTNELFYPRIVALKLKAQILINPEPERGMASSAIIGLSAIENECRAVFLCPVDYPLIQPATYQRLLLAHRSHPECIVQPVFNQRGGHPIVLPAGLFSAVRTVSLNEGVRSLIRQYAHAKKSIIVNDPGILININTPENYYQYCQ